MLYGRCHFDTPSPPHTHIHTPLTQHLEQWIQSSDETERVRAMTCLLQLLRAYQAHSDENEPSRHLPLQGQILGRMVPRCSDPNLSIRQMSIDSIQVTLKIAACMPGRPKLYCVSKISKFFFLLCVAIAWNLKKKEKIFTFIASVFHEWVS